MLINSNKIKNLRMSKGWSQQNLADFCELNIRTIQRIEKNGVASLETTKAICSVFEIEITTILQHQTDPVPFNIAPLFLTLLIGMILGFSISFFLLT